MNLSKVQAAVRDSPQYGVFQSLHRKVCAVDLCMRKLAESLARTFPPVSDEPGDTYRAIATRAAAWTFSLRRLDDPFDLQAQSAACRALLELHVDVELLRRDPLTNVRRLLAYEDREWARASEEVLANSRASEGEKQLAREFLEAHGR